MNPLLRVRASAHIEQRNARIVVRNDSRSSHPRANVDVLELALGGGKNRGDVHVVKGLGVHVVGAIALVWSVSNLEESVCVCDDEEKQGT